jgi:two-component system cell cycle sensor histidine kinase/response regulator CckA
MTEAAGGDTEAQRLQALTRFHVLDTPAEEMFDELTSIAAAVCGTPISLLTLLDDKRQWFKARVGLDVSETPRSLAFCHHTIQQDHPFVVTDARADARFADNPLVTGEPHIRFYAGAPLVVGENHHLGTICVIDREPRELEEWQLTTLASLARHASTIIELRARELEFRTFMELSPDGIVVVGEDARIRFANAALQRLVGADAAQLVGSDAQALCYEDAPAVLPRVLREVFEEQHREVARTALRTMEGEPVEVELTFGYQTISGEPMCQITVHDIRERVAAEREARELQMIVQTVVENAPAAVWVKDLEGRYVIANRETYTATAAEVDDMVGHTDHELFPPEIADRFVRFDQEALGGTVVHQEDRSLVDPSRVYATLTFPLRDPDGNVFGIGGIATDVSSQRKDQRQAQLLQQRLEQVDRLESLGKLAGGIAHDFNNLLAVIMTSAEFAADTLRERQHDDPVLSEALGDLDDVWTAARRAAALTQQLLVFARRQPTEAQRVDLNAAVTTTTSLLRRTLGGDIDVRLDLADDLPPVVVDPSQIDQVLVNLAVNARDAMPGGGTLTVATRLADPSSLPADAPPATYVELEVADDGVGMLPEVAARAFEPFFSTKETGAGTGLGLATVYGIVTAADGFVYLQSAPGEGTAVRICLPAAESGDAPPPTGQADAPSGEGQTILVVDDAPANLRIVARILERAGFTVLTAADADQALAVVAERGDELSLLLSDVVMPGMSGIELAAQVRAERPHLPVLLMSGYPDAAAGEIAGPPVPLVSKPFTASQLLGSIEAALGVR